MRKIIFLLFLCLLFFAKSSPAIAQCQIDFSSVSPNLSDRVNVVVRGLTGGGTYSLTHNNTIIRKGLTSCGTIAASNGIIIWENIEINQIENNFSVYRAGVEGGFWGGCNLKQQLLCTKILTAITPQCEFNVTGISPNISIQILHRPNIDIGNLRWVLQTNSGSTLQSGCYPTDSLQSVFIGQLGNETFRFLIKNKKEGSIGSGCVPGDITFCGIIFVVEDSIPRKTGPITSAPITPAPGATIDPTCLLPDGKTGIRTALGCIPASDLNDFVGWLLKNVIFVASGIAFLLMAFGALQIITSAGSPDKMKAGSELITSALSGLLLIILSLFLLKLIGVDILQIPGFGK